MTEFRAGLAAFLAASCPSVEGRVHPDVLPDKPGLPALAYQLISSIGGLAHDQAIDLRNVRVQIDAWAMTLSEAAAAALEVKRALNGYKGPLGDLAYSAAWSLEGEFDGVEEETRLYRVSLDFRGWYEEEG